jgi:hypothetical protein
MPATALQTQITRAIMGVVADFNAAGTDSAVTVSREDENGVIQTLGTASPVYVVQEEVSRVEGAHAGLSATLRTRYAMYADVADLAVGATTIQVGDTLTIGGGYSFLVTGLDLLDLSGAAVGSLELQPYE